jgi:hypothetical protein
MIYDSGHFPREFREKIYGWINSDLRAEKKEKDTDEQFIYKTRKKGFGRFKEDMWTLPPAVLEAIGAELQKKFSFLFEKLNLPGTRDIMDRLVKPVDVPLEVPSQLKQ